MILLLKKNVMWKFYLINCWIWVLGIFTKCLGNCVYLEFSILFIFVYVYYIKFCCIIISLFSTNIYYLHKIFLLGTISSVQFSHSVESDSLQPMDCSMPGFPVHHQLPELAQMHVHQVSDVIQPFHPLSSPSPAFSLSSIRVLSNESGGQSFGVSASVLPVNSQDWFLFE